MECRTIEGLLYLCHTVLFISIITLTFKLTRKPNDNQEIIYDSRQVVALLFIYLFTRLYLFLLVTRFQTELIYKFCSCYKYVYWVN